MYHSQGDVQAAKDRFHCETLSQRNELLFVFRIVEFIERMIISNNLRNDIFSHFLSYFSVNRTAIKRLLSQYKYISEEKLNRIASFHFFLLCILKCFNFYFGIWFAEIHISWMFSVIIRYGFDGFLHNLNHQMRVDKLKNKTPRVHSILIWSINLFYLTNTNNKIDWNNAVVDDCHKQFFFASLNEFCACACASKQI